MRRGDESWTGALLGPDIRSPRLKRVVFRPGQTIEVLSPDDSIIKLGKKQALGHWLEYRFSKADADQEQIKLMVFQPITRHGIDLNVREYTVELISNGKRYLVKRSDLQDKELIKDIFKPGSSVSVHFQDGEPGSVQLGDKLHQGNRFVVQVPEDFSGNPVLNFVNASDSNPADESFIEYEKQKMIPLTSAETERLLAELDKVKGVDCENYKARLRESISSKEPTWAIIEGPVEHNGQCSRLTESILPKVLDADAKTRSGQETYIAKPRVSAPRTQAVDSGGGIRKKKRRNSDGSNSDAIRGD